MTVTPKRDALFPTLVYDLTVPDAATLNAQLHEAILAERATDPGGLTRSNDPQNGGWHSRDTLQDQPDYSMLAHVIREAMQSIGSDLGYAAEIRTEIDSLWAIINGPGAANRAHLHPGSLWSGVYYVKAEAGCGEIEFTDPRTANLMRQPAFAERSPLCAPAVRYQPIAGRMLIFPSWLYHAVHPNRSGADRIIISFNVSLI